MGIPSRDRLQSSHVTHNTRSAGHGHCCSPLAPYVCCIQNRQALLLQELPLLRGLMSGRLHSEALIFHTQIVNWAMENCLGIFLPYTCDLCICQGLSRRHLPTAFTPSEEFIDNLPWLVSVLLFKKLLCRAGSYSAYMHMEHDVEGTWAAVGAWAADNALLEPLGFQRGFVRTEIAPWSGRAMAADAQAPVSAWKLRCHTPNQAHLRLDVRVYGLYLG